MEALRKQLADAKASEEKLKAEQTAKTEEETTAAQALVDEEIEAKDYADKESGKVLKTMEVQAAAASEEKRVLETEATQAALQYLQKLASVEAAANARQEAEEQAVAALRQELAEANATIEAREAAIVEATEYQVALEQRKAQMQLAATEAAEALRAEREAQKKAKAEWDQLSRSALDEMFELRKRMAQHEANMEQNTEFIRMLTAKHLEEQNLIDNFLSSQEQLKRKL